MFISPVDGKQTTKLETHIKRGKIFSTKKSTKLAKIKKSRKKRWGLSSSSESEETENKRKNLQGGKGKGHQPTKQDQLQNQRFN